MCKSHDWWCLGMCQAAPCLLMTAAAIQTCCPDCAVRVGLQLEWEQVGTFPVWWVERQTRTNRSSILVWLCWCLFQAWQLPQLHSTFPSLCLLTHMKMALLSHLNALHLKLPGCFFTFTKSLKVPPAFSLPDLPGSRCFWMCKRLPVRIRFILYLME